MARWVVPQRWYLAQQIPKRVASAGATTDVSTTQTEEGYLDKLARYIPAEVLTASLLVAALNNGDDRWLLGILAAGFVATPIYHFTISRNAELEARPKRYFYALSSLAFLGWALGASQPIAKMIGWTQPHLTTVMVASAMGIPLVDSFLDHVTDKGTQPWRRFLGG